MNTQHVSILLIVTCFLITLGVALAYGQSDEDPAVIGEYIQRNAELLDRAKELVSASNSAKARSSLETAAGLHLRSISLFTTDNFYRAALIAKHARNAILQTIALAKREAKLEASAAKAIERATNRLEQARHLAGDRSRDSAPTRKLIEEAMMHLERSHRNMREHLFEASLRLAMSSERLSSQAIVIMRRDFADPEAIRRELAKTDEILERVGEQIGSDAGPAVEKMYAEARDTQRKAQRQFREQHFLIAVELTEQARKMAMRAVRLLAGGENADNVEQAIRLTDMLIDEAREIADERDADRLSKRIDRAADIQSDARRSFSEGRYAQALKLTLRAREILKSALRAVRRALGADEVRSTLVETDRALERLREALGDSANDTALDMYGRALAQQDKAWEEFRQEKFRAALAHTRLARKLANRSIRILNDEES